MADFFAIRVGYIWLIPNGMKVMVSGLFFYRA